MDEDLKYQLSPYELMEFGIATIEEPGKIQLPAVIQHSLHLKKGDKVVVIVEDEKVLLSKLKSTKQQFRIMLNKSHEQIKKQRINQKDLNKAIHKVRNL